jgi:hypothetical protein
MVRSPCFRRGALRRSGAGFAPGPHCTARTVRARTASPAGGTAASFDRTRSPGSSTVRQRFERQTGPHQYRLVVRVRDLLNASAEWWPSGRRHTPAKGADGKPSRGFESLPLRQPPRSRFPCSVSPRIVPGSCGVGAPSLQERPDKAALSGGSARAVSARPERRSGFVGTSLIHGTKQRIRSNIPSFWSFAACKNYSGSASYQSDSLRDQAGNYFSVAGNLPGRTGSGFAIPGKGAGAVFSCRRNYGTVRSHCQSRLCSSWRMP